MLFILDRDGVVNHDSEAYVKSPAEWVPIAGSLEAISSLNQHGHTVVVATNQSGVGRGLYTLETMHAINDKMCAEVTNLGGRIDKVYFCPHRPEEGCACRKPQPGMLFDIREDYQEIFSEAVLIGDSLRDIEAGLAAGIAVILVKTGNGTKSLESPEKLKNVMVFDSLAHAASAWLR